MWGLVDWRAAVHLGLGFVVGTLWRICAEFVWFAIAFVIEVK